MSEYQIHTDHRDYAMKILYHGVLPIFIASCLAYTAVLSDKASQHRYRELERARAMTDHFSSLQRDPTPTLTNDQIEANQLLNFRTAVQQLIVDGWSVDQIGTDGTIIIKGENMDLRCGVLDPSPNNRDDNPYTQAKDLSSYLDEIGADENGNVWLINGRDVANSAGINISGESKSSENIVWACSAN